MSDNPIVDACAPHIGLSNTSQPTLASPAQSHRHWSSAISRALQMLSAAAEDRAYAAAYEGFPSSSDRKPWKLQMS
jgi:hypothetical protein